MAEGTRPDHGSPRTFPGGAVLLGGPHAERWDKAAAIVMQPEALATWCDAVAGHAAPPPLFVTVPADDPDPDLLATLASRPVAGLWLVRCEGRVDLERAAARLAVAEAQAGRLDGSLGLAASIGTAAGALTVPSLAGSSPRLVAIALNEEGLRLDLGLPVDAPPSGACLYARSAIALAARAAGVPAIDGLTQGKAPAVGAAAQVARLDGFKGKLAASPAQVEPIARAFA